MSYAKSSSTKMGSVEAAKPHAVFIPFPAQGHVNPTMQIAKLLHSKGFHITFVHTEFYQGRLIRSPGLDALSGLTDFKFMTIPDGLPPSDRFTTRAPPALFNSTRKNCLAPFVELIKTLNSSGEVPPVTCIVADLLMSFGIKAGDILGLPVVSLFTSAACSLVGYWQYIELLERGIVPFKDEKFLTDGTLDTPVDWIPGITNLRLKDLPTTMRVTDVNDISFDFLKTESQNCLKSSGIILNTFDEFEKESLDYIASKFRNIYAIGPLPLLCRHIPESDCFKSFRSGFWKEDSECLKWLDKRKPNSVAYVNFGSTTMITDQQLKEFAWGLANSKCPFLLVVRPHMVMGASAILPEEFIEEVKDRGLIASWCPQQEVLSHPSVAVFLTHCGWNSIVESVCGGVPVICWPFFADQPINCRFACTTWGTGMEINKDVKRGDIEATVKEMVDGVKGKQMREKALEWKKKAEAATDIGGASYNNLDRLIKEALHHRN